MTAGDPLWIPTDTFAEGTAIARYLRWLSEELGLDFDSYHEAQT